MPITERPPKDYLEQPLKDEYSQCYLPLPRHRRRIIFNLIKRIKFEDCVDVGCAQSYLLEAIAEKYGVRAHGCDILEEIVVENRKKFPHIEFSVLDIENDKWPYKQFDLVICSEVLEHIIEWRNALENLATMSKRYLLISVPGGKLRKTDTIVGHYRHYQGDELVTALREQGFKPVKMIRHGFPVHSFYKLLINWIMPENLYHSFHHQTQYSIVKKIIAHALYGLFFINYFFSSGNQLYILAERCD